MKVTLLCYDNMTQKIGTGKVIGMSTANVVKFIDQNLVKYKVQMDQEASDKKIYLTTRISVFKHGSDSEIEA